MAKSDIKRPFTQARFRLSLDILDPDAAVRPEARSRLFDAAQKPRVVFEPIIKPIIAGSEADQHPGRFPVPGDDDFFALGFAQKPREVALEFDSGIRLTPDLRIASVMPYYDHRAGTIIKNPSFTEARRMG